VKGIGPAQTGSVTAEGVVLPMPIILELDPLVGYADVPAGCQIGPVEGSFLASSYDEVTGETEMVNADRQVPAITTCGDWNAAFNAYLGLPTLGNGVMQSTILDAAGNPIDLA
jgi:hypothetical protein